MSNVYENNKCLREYRKSLSLSQDYVAKQIVVLASELGLFSKLFGVSVERILHGEIEQDSDVRMLARAFLGLSNNDKKEIMNLIDFKKKFKESLI